MFSDLVGEHPKKMQRVQMIGVVLQNLPIKLFDLWQVACGMMLDGQVQNLLDRGGPFLPSHSFNSPPVKLIRFVASILLYDDRAYSCRGF